LAAASAAADALLDCPYFGAFRFFNASSMRAFFSSSVNSFS